MQNKSFVLKNAKVYDKNFDLKKLDISISGETISDIKENVDSDMEVLDLSGLIVLPGLIDIHIHGGDGHDTCDGSPDDIHAISEYLIKRGITSFCPTSMTLPYETLRKVFEVIRDVKPKLKGAYAHGINMEGPYISVEKKGAQNPEYVRVPDKDEFFKLHKASGTAISLVDIAPESSNAVDFAKEVAAFTTVSIAHTDANYDETMKGIENGGITHVTHLFNAMTPFNHRNPGVVGAVFDYALSSDNKANPIYGELICDGHHIHAAALRIAFKILGENGSVIVSDSMKAAGLKDGKYDLGGLDVYVRNGLATLEDGTIAASTTNIYDSLKHVFSIGVPTKQAIKSATINPAKAVGVDKVTGSIEAGKNADLLVVDDNFNIKVVIVKGNIRINNL